jgi:iron complex transport system substrate-binding protein
MALMKTYGRIKAVCIFMALLAVLACVALSGCSASAKVSNQSSSTRMTQTAFHNTDLGCGWQPVSSMDLQYADQFTIDYYDGGYALACVADGSRYLFVPDGKSIPDGLASDILPIGKGINNIYMVATDTMCLFDALDSVDRIGVSGTQADGWYIDSARSAMESGAIVYGGKYNTPDYDVILSHGCKLAIESNMINHSPDVKEKLEELGVSVLVEQSSYESEPLGRAEWIKFYGALFGMEDQAQQIFDAQTRQVKAIEGQDTGKTVAFFYISSNGNAITRKSGDYVSKMIAAAGGSNVFANLGDAEGTSTVTLEMEKFYATAKDADIIIYNATIDGEVASIDQLTAKNELLKDFKAVRSGEVYCTDQNMYQQMIQTGTIISDFHTALMGGDSAKLVFLHKLS